MFFYRLPSVQFQRRDSRNKAYQEDPVENDHPGIDGPQRLPVDREHAPEHAAAEHGDDTGDICFIVSLTHS